MSNHARTGRGEAGGVNSPWASSGENSFESDHIVLFLFFLPCVAQDSTTTSCAHCCAVLLPLCDPLTFLYQARRRGHIGA